MNQLPLCAVALALARAAASRAASDSLYSSTLHASLMPASVDDLVEQLARDRRVDVDAHERLAAASVRPTCIEPMLMLCAPSIVPTLPIMPGRSS